MNSLMKTVPRFGIWVALLTLGFFLTAAVLLAAASPPTGSSSPAGSSPVTRPQSGLSASSFLVGTWECMGRATGKDRYPFAMVTDLAYDQHWLRTREVIAKGVYLPDRPFYDDQFWTYQPDTNSWAGFELDNTGEYSYGWSKGWFGNRFAIAGYYTNRGKEMPFRNTLVKISDTVIEHRYQEPGSHGVLRVTYSDHCFKRSVR